MNITDKAFRNAHCVRFRKPWENGFVFSLDAGIAFVLAACIIALSLNAIAQSTREKIASEKEFELWKNTVFIADSLVKNNYSENSLLGSAVFDLEKHRVKSNEISLELLQKVSEIANKEFELKQVKVVFQNLEEQIVFQENTEKRNCIAVERIALVEGQIAKIGVVGCAE